MQRSIYGSMFTCTWGKNGQKAAAEQKAKRETKRIVDATERNVRVWATFNNLPKFLLLENWKLSAESVRINIHPKLDLFTPK